MPSITNTECTAIPSLPPVITITPATLIFENLPLTPDSLGSPKPSCLKHKHQVPPTPSSPVSIPPASCGGVLPVITDRYDTPSSLLIPLQRHLALIHPQTPKEIIAFVATRLLSSERPFGHIGPWKALGEGEDVDLSTAGVGLEATKGCEQRDGEGKELDKKLESMYSVARESWRKLGEIAPTGGRVASESW